MLVLAAAGVLQMFLGAWIVFSRDMVYDVYEVCGRAWPIDPDVDQLLGGMLTYIPPAMMSILGILLILRRAMHKTGNTQNLPDNPRNQPNEFWFYQKTGFQTSCNFHGHAGRISGWVLRQRDKLQRQGY
jgi:hypothetical protein